MTEFDRITPNPAVTVGKACIRGMRVTVEMIVGQLGSGTTIDELLDAYPYIERGRDAGTLRRSPRQLARDRISLSVKTLADARECGAAPTNMRPDIQNVICTTPSMLCFIQDA